MNRKPFQKDVTKDLFEGFTLKTLCPLCIFVCSREGFDLSTRLERDRVLHIYHVIWSLELPSLPNLQTNMKSGSSDNVTDLNVENRAQSCGRSLVSSYLVELSAEGASCL